jgi:hypothetical protein
VSSFLFESIEDRFEGSESRFEGTEDRFERRARMDNYMYKRLKPHLGHTIVCVYYGDMDNPADICIECDDCNEVLISAEDYDFQEEKTNDQT